MITLTAARQGQVVPLPEWQTSTIKKGDKTMGLKFYGKSQEVAEKIISQFETGSVPGTLANVFINRTDDIPSGSWSFRNRFIMAICGASDARGFKQWQLAGRRVSKGSKALHILGPCIGKKKDDDGKDEKFLYGFKSIPVFALESTEVFDSELWEIAGGVDMEEENRLASLPLRDVAEAWGLNVTSYSGKNSGYAGYYRHGETIALGVENLSTWAHELVHAADDRLNTLTKCHGQNAGNEIVAELGGAALLKIMGFEIEADIGGAWDYVKSYAKNDKDKALNLCSKLLDRLCGCIDLIINTATEIGEGHEGS